MAENFKAVLEAETAAEKRPVRIEGNFQKVARELNKQFLGCTRLVDLQCGEAAATVISNWEEFLQKMLGLEKRSEDELESSAWSADHGGTTLKVTASFRFATGDEQKHKPSRFAPMGVRKMYSLALVSGVKESYEVMNALFAALALPKLKFLLEKHGAKVAMVNDIKMWWICHGKSHGGRRSCL